MEFQSSGDLNASTKNLDHLGLVAATLRDLKVGDRINARIFNGDPRRIVNTGDAVLAMVLNGLGFTNRRVYLTPQFFESKPVEDLISPRLQAKHLDDHALGKALDEISEYGASRLFGEIAMEIGLEHKLFQKTAHMDSTSFSVQGEYEHEGVTAISVTHGYSKDHRPDLKQVMLLLCTSGSSDFPFWIEPQSGNSSDKTEFTKTIQKIRAFKEQLKNSPDFRWIADSALYTKEGLLDQNAYNWITRVPETMKEARHLIEKDAVEIAWVEYEKGYKIAAFPSNYGNQDQRWVLVYSQQAYDRERKTFEKSLAKKQEALEKELWHLSNKIFGCESDLIKALEALKKEHLLFTITVRVEPVMKNKSRGRPKEDSEKQCLGYQLQGTVQRNEETIELQMNRKGRFILATNELNKENLPDQQILSEYKEQQGVERGFRFLKDPWFMIDSIFLKSPKRIEALMMVMTLCLMIYNIAQNKIRNALEEKNQTVPNQLNKPIANPTLRWIFQIMEGISKIYFYEAGRWIKNQTSNLTALRRQIIHLFGPTAMSIYGIP